MDSFTSAREDASEIISEASATTTATQTKSKSLKLRSEIWNHCRTKDNGLLQEDEPDRSDSGQLLYYCRYCSNKPVASTTNMRNHIRSYHSEINLSRITKNEMTTTSVKE